MIDKIKEIFKKIFLINIKSNPKRNELLDYLRGIGVFLILLHHSMVPYNEYILIFHMPLFFIISGYTIYIKGGEKDNFKDFILKKVKRLLIPYFLFEILNLFIWFIISTIEHNSFSILKALYSILVCINTDNYLGLYGRLWFLPCIFISEVIFYIILKKFNNKYLKAISFILLLVMSYITTKVFNFRLPFTFDISLLATSYIFVGYFLASTIKYLLEKSKFILDIVLIIILSFITFSIVKYGHGEMNMYINKYGRYIPSIIGGLTGSFTFIILVKYIYKYLSNLKCLKNIILWYSYNSLVVFPIHLIIKCLLPIIGLSSIYNKWYLLLITMFILTIPISNFITYYTPFMLGITKNKKKVQ